MAKSDKIRARKYCAKQGGSVEADLRDCIYQISGESIYLHSKETTYQAGMRVASEKLNRILEKAMNGAKTEIKNACPIIEQKWEEVYQACGFTRGTKKVRENFPQWWKTNIEDYGVNSTSQFKLLAKLQRIKELETIEKKYTEARKRAVNKGDESILIKEGFFNPITGEDHAQEIGVRQANTSDPISEKRKELKELRSAFVEGAVNYFYKELPESKMTQSGRIKDSLKRFWDKLRDSDKESLLSIFDGLPDELKQKITGEQAMDNITEPVQAAVDNAIKSNEVQKKIKQVGYATGIGILWEGLSHGFKNKTENKGKNVKVQIENISELSDSAINNSLIKSDSKITIGDVVFFTNDKTTIIPKFGWQPQNAEKALTELGNFGTPGFSAGLSTSLKTTTVDLGADTAHLVKLQNYVLANSSFSNRTTETEKRIILSIYAWLKIVLEIIGKDSENIPIGIRVFGYLYRTDEVLKQIEKLTGTEILQIVKGINNSKFLQARFEITQADREAVQKRKGEIIQQLKAKKQEIYYKKLYEDDDLQSLFQKIVAKKMLEMPTSLYFQIKLQNDTIRIGE